MLTVQNTDSKHVQVINAMADLERIPVTPRGERSNRWQGVQHADFVRSLARAIRSHGWEIDKTTAAVVRGGAGLIGSFDVHPIRNDAPGRFPDVLLRTMTPTIGFRHGNDSKHALHVYFGANVTVCTNGMIMGSRSLGGNRRHTNGLNLYPWIHGAVRVAFQGAEKLDVNVTTMAETPLGAADDSKLNGAMCGLARGGLMPWSLVGKVDREFSAPRHLDFADKNVWSWYNCVTEIAKEQSPDQQFKTLEGAWTMAKELAQLN